MNYLTGSLKAQSTTTTLWDRFFVNTDTGILHAGATLSEKAASNRSHACLAHSEPAAMHSTLESAKNV